MNEDKIAEAIDRNTDRIVNAIRASALLIAFFLFLAGIIAKATPLLPPLDQPIIVEIGTPPLPPPNPHIQYWYTVDIPTDGGVYPLEVYAPALPPLIHQPQIVEIGEPPAPPVDVPEPGTWEMVAGALAVVALYALALWDQRREKRRDLELDKLHQELIERVTAKIDRYETALQHISENSKCLDSQAVARKALEG